MLVADQFAHNSIDEGLKLAKARGVRTAKFAHNDPAALEADAHGAAAVPPRGGRGRRRVQHERAAAAAGRVPPDRARPTTPASTSTTPTRTGVLGEQGRGTVLDALGDYDNVLMVGSLSKGFSCLGGFVAGPRAAIDVLKLRSNSLIFGGPVPPPYLEAVCTVLDILNVGRVPARSARSSTRTSAG